MFRNYWKISDEKLEKLAQEHHLQGFLEKSGLHRDENNPHFVVNRKYVIDQLLQKDNRNIAFCAAIVSIIGAIISLFANF